DDTTYNAINSITMGGDQTVQVEFELAVAKNLLVPEEYESIEDAVLVARDGDTIVLDTRPNEPYTITEPEGINFYGKQLTLTSMNPNDPYVVANTIIDAQGSRYNRKRAFIFNNGEDPSTVIQGVTIRNAFWAGEIGLSGVLPTGIWPPDPTITPPPPERALSGYDAEGDGYGGAILVTNGSSPTIRKVVFENCTVTGGIGGDGNDGYPQDTTGLTGNIDGQSGGHGGDGSGDGYGDAIAVVGASSPIIEECIFRNNRATGGWGGIPGDGGFAVGSGRYSWGGDAGNGFGDGRGGAIYIAEGCSPVVTKNVFEGNYVRLGYVSEGGLGRGGNAYPEPWDPENWPSRDGSDGYLVGNGRIVGGAVYYGMDAESAISDSTFEGNMAYYPSPSPQITDIVDYTRGGAIFADPNVTLTLEGCEFIDNLGGALYLSTGSAVQVFDSIFEGNASYDPQGGKASISVMEITNWDYPATADSQTAVVRLQPAGAITIKNGASNATRIMGCRFIGNLSESSGGAIQSESDITISETKFVRNDAILRGGGLFVYRHLPDPNETETIEVTISDTEFTYNNSEELGGGLWGKNNHLDLQRSQFVGNTAPSGGGLMTVQSNLTMADGLFVGNQATGKVPTFQMALDSQTGFEFAIVSGLFEAQQDYHPKVVEGVGGGLCLVTTNTWMVDTRILDNTSEGVSGGGAGLAIKGGIEDVLTQNLHNCLIVGNTSENHGGGVKIMTYAQPRFDNCTIADNSTEGLGGGLYVDWTAKARIYNSILANNRPADTYEQTAGSIITDAVYFGNPKFVTGPLGDYYLDPLSPAVNAGSTTARAVALDQYTTNPSISPIILDTGVVDLGYHYENPGNLERLTLTVAVLDEQGISRGSVSFQPESQTPGLYYYGQFVDLSVSIPSGYIITGWTGGTVRDGATDTTNTVIMTSDKDIVVHVRQRKTYYVGGSMGIPDMQDAIDAAQDGDQILVYPGTYAANIITGEGPSSLRTISFNGKTLRISGLKPDDEDVVRQTEFYDYILMLENLSEESVIEGITFRSCSGYIIGGAPTLRNVIFSECQWRPGDGDKDLNCGNSVVDGDNGGSIFG
ncbi:MAG: hypothetical protein GX298_05300, partial [Planctomycetes bacterium]|nr:hypothetical protein [Planctomycetota bacterium]